MFPATYITGNQLKKMFLCIMYNLPGFLSQLTENNSSGFRTNTSTTKTTIAIMQQ